MYMLKVTLTATNTPQPIIPSGVFPGGNFSFQNIVPQYNGVNVMYLGDAFVSATNGLKLTPGGSLGVFLPLQYNGDLRQFFAYGTSGDVLNIMVFP